MTVKQKSYLYFGLSVAGLFSTVGLAIWADRKVKASADPEEQKWKKYVPYAAPAAAGALTITAMALNQASSTKEMARLAGVAGLAASQLSQYKGAVRNEIGDEAADKIEAIVSPPSEPSSDVVPMSKIMSGDDIITCYDELTGVTFESTVVEVLEAEMDMNRRFQYGEYIEIADWLGYFDAECPPEFNGCGWEMGLVVSEYGACWIDFSHKLHMMGDVACNVIEIKTPFYSLGGVYEEQKLRKVV